MSTQVEVEGRVIAVRTSRADVGFVVEMHVTASEWVEMHGKRVTGMGKNQTASSVVRKMIDGKWDGCGPARQIWR